jgi:hypothetical protein
MSERDALVVETTGFTEKSWLDGAGDEAMPITKRYHRRDFGQMDLQLILVTLPAQQDGE